MKGILSPLKPEQRDRITGPAASGCLLSVVGGHSRTRLLGWPCSGHNCFVFISAEATVSIRGF